MPKNFSNSNFFWWKVYSFNLVRFLLAQYYESLLGVGRKMQNLSIFFSIKKSLSFYNFKFQDIFIQFWRLLLMQQRALILLQFWGDNWGLGIRPWAGLVLTLLLSFFFFLFFFQLICLVIYIEKDVFKNIVNKKIFLLINWEWKKIIL